MRKMAHETSEGKVSRDPRVQKQLRTSNYSYRNWYCNQGSASEVKVGRVSGYRVSPESRFQRVGVGYTPGTRC
jgi:hypothetical protein